MAVSHIEFRYSRVRLWVTTSLTRLFLRAALWSTGASLRSFRWRNTGRRVFAEDHARRQAAVSLARICSGEG